MDEVMSVSDAKFYYIEDKVIFENVSFSLKQGEILTILGPNGAGKSTMLSCLVGLNSLKSGNIYLGGTRLEELSHRQIARMVGFLPQNLSAVFAYSVMEYVVMGRAPYISTLRKPSSQDYMLAAKMIDKMGLSHLATRSYGSLSGGERQQAAIARILVQQPKLIILDEPTSALDFGNQIKIIRMAKELSQDGYSVIMTTHNPDHAIMLDGMAGVLDRKGRFIVGQSKDVITEEFLSEVYQINVKISYVEKVKRLACLAEFNKD